MSQDAVGSISSVMAILFKNEHGWGPERVSVFRDPAGCITIIDIETHFQNTADIHGTIMSVDDAKIHVFFNQMLHESGTMVATYLFVRIDEDNRPLELDPLHDLGYIVGAMCR